MSVISIIVSAAISWSQESVTQPRSLKWVVRIKQVFGTQQGPKQILQCWTQTDTSRGILSAVPTDWSYFFFKQLIIFVLAYVAIIFFQIWWSGSASKFYLNIFISLLIEGQQFYNNILYVWLWKETKISPLKTL